MRFKDNFLPVERKGLCKCGKVSFDKKTAQTKRNFLLNRGNDKVLRIYQCPDSDWWHLTSKAKWT